MEQVFEFFPVMMNITAEEVGELVKEKEMIDLSDERDWLDSPELIAGIQLFIGPDQNGDWREKHDADKYSFHQDCEIVVELVDGDVYVVNPLKMSEDRLDQFMMEYKDQLSDKIPPYDHYGDRADLGKDERMYDFW